MYEHRLCQTLLITTRSLMILIRAEDARAYGYVWADISTKNCPRKANTVNGIFWGKHSIHSWTHWRREEFLTRGWLDWSETNCFWNYFLKTDVISKFCSRFPCVTCYLGDVRHATRQKRSEECITHDQMILSFSSISLCRSRILRWWSNFLVRRSELVHLLLNIIMTRIVEDVIFTTSKTNQRTTSSSTSMMILKWYFDKEEVSFDIDFKIRKLIEGSIV